MRHLIIVILTLSLLTSCAGVGRRGPSQMGNEASEIVRSSRSTGEEGGFKPGPQFNEDLKGKIASEYWALEGRRKPVPLTLNDQVKASMEYFLTDARRFMIRSLGRSHKYAPMMQNILIEKGLPPELVYMSLVESGFRAEAVSPAGAVGPWQFISATGRRYGLKIDDWVDERMDPVRSTYAAADYLSDLHDMFNSWHLAAAGYNCGEAKVEKGLAANKVDNFWDLAAVKNCLREETKNYVPHILATIIIAQDPERYGLTGIEPQKPDEYDDVVIPTATDLDVIARLAGVDEEKVRELNPHLKLWATPLDEKDYALRLPKGTGVKFRTAYARLNPHDRLKTSVHIAQGRESLKKIGQTYQLSANTLMKFNNLKSSHLRTGQKIKLPVDPKLYARNQQIYQAKMAAERKKLESMGNRVEYTVKKGDNPWLIGRKYDVHWKDIAAWNDIQDVRKLRPGDKLLIYLGSPPSSADIKPAKTKVKTAKTDARTVKNVSSERNSTPEIQPAVYKVQDGDTLWKISKRFKIKPEEITSANGISGNTIRPGQQLKIPGSLPVKKAAVQKAKTDSPTKPAPEQKVSDKKISDSKKKPAASVKNQGGATYTVQQDDTLWRIAHNHGISSAQIREANNLSGNNIRPGQVLTIPSKGQTASAASPEQAKQKPSSSPSAGKAVDYKVQDGDTLWKIARLFKVKPEDIRAWNGKKDDSLKPGEVLKIRTEKQG